MAPRIDQLEDFNVTAHHIRVMGAWKEAASLQFPLSTGGAGIPVIGLTGVLSAPSWAGIRPTPASSGCEKMWGRELVRGDNVNPLLILHARNIGSHYRSPQRCLAPIPDILTFIMTFTGCSPNTRRQPGCYGDASAAAEKTHERRGGEIILIQ